MKKVIASEAKQSPKDKIAAALKCLATCGIAAASADGGCRAITGQQIFYESIIVYPKRDRYAIFSISP